MTTSELHRRTRTSGTMHQMLAPSNTPSTDVSNNSGPFRSIGEQLVSVRNAGISGSHKTDPRLYEVNRRGIPIGNSEQVPSEGGFLLQNEFSQEIVKRAYETGEIFRRCLQMPITKPNAAGIKFPQFDELSRQNGSRLGGLKVYWKAEADNIAATVSQPKFLLTEQNANKLLGLMYVSDEMAQDTDLLDRFATYAFSQELTFVLEGSILGGYGQMEPLGVLNSGALVTVPKEAGQAAGTVISPNIEQMLAAFWTSSYNSDASVWLYNQALLPQMASLSQIVGSAGSESKMWQWATASDQYDLLCGIPAVQSEHCQIPGTFGDIMLCDFSRYVISMLQWMKTDVSIHVYFLSDQNAYRFSIRVAGMPVDRAPVTPLNGTQPTSPFVALAQRS